MTRQEVREYVKRHLKSLGFTSYKSYFYRILDEDYLIGFHLYPTTNTKGYTFVCGIIYLPDELKMPLRGVFDLEWDFRFPREPSMELHLETLRDDLPPLELMKRNLVETQVFEYEKYTLEQLEKFFTQNYAHFIEPLFDKNYGLNIFRKDWTLFRRFAPETVSKICRRADLNEAEVFEFLAR